MSGDREGGAREEGGGEGIYRKKNGEGRGTEEILKNTYQGKIHWVALDLQEREVNNVPGRRGRSLLTMMKKGRKGCKKGQGRTEKRKCLRSLPEGELVWEGAVKGLATGIKIEKEKRREQREVKRGIKGEKVLSERRCIQKDE